MSYLAVESPLWLLHSISLRQIQDEGDEDDLDRDLSGVWTCADDRNLF